MRTLAAVTVLLALCGIAAAQTTTTYTMPDGIICQTVEGCYYHNLTATAPDDSMLWGLFEAGGYWTQFDYQAFQGQNPGYKALYCNGTAVWTTATMDNGDTQYVMDCQGTPDGTSSDPPAKLHAEIERTVLLSLTFAASRYGPFATRRSGPWTRARWRLRGSEGVSEGGEHWHQLQCSGRSGQFKDRLPKLLCRWRFNHEAQKAFRANVGTNHVGPVRCELCRLCGQPGQTQSLPTNRNG